MKKWVCSVCGYVYEGENPPEKCPQCGVPASKFTEQKGELSWAAEHVVGVAQGVDPERVAVMGDSSGGHTALMTGITGGTQELDTALYGEYPCTVRAIVDYYGPTDVSKMCERPSTQNHVDPDSPEGRLIGGLNVLENPDKVAPTVVMNHVPEASQRKPPLLMFHGTKDRLVPFEQSLLLYDKMKQAGQDVTLYRVEGADHGGPAFWAQNVLDLVDEFLKEHLK